LAKKSYFTPLETILNSAPGDGACRTFVKFRYIVFRPFLNEVIVGKVRSCSKDGLRISVDFFDDIFVPSQNIRQRNSFEMENGRPKWILDFKKC